MVANAWSAAMVILYKSQESRKIEMEPNHTISASMIRLVDNDINNFNWKSQNRGQPKQFIHWVQNHIFLQLSQKLIAINFGRISEVKSLLRFNNNGNLSLSNPTGCNVASAQVCALQWFFLEIQVMKPCDFWKIGIFLIQF